MMCTWNSRNVCPSHFTLELSPCCCQYNSLTAAEAVFGFKTKSPWHRPYRWMCSDLGAKYEGVFFFLNDVCYVVLFADCFQVSVILWP